jgi:ketosteroid isomerase-like protein
VSQESVELVRSFHPAPDVDLAPIYREDSRWARASSLLAPHLAQDFKCIAHGYPGFEGESFAGLAGLRYLWLEWLTPWKSYRAQVEEMIDLGDDVLVLVRDFGSRSEEIGEIAVASAAVWTVRDRKLVQITFYADRSTALKAVGLAE